MEFRGIQMAKRILFYGRDIQADRLARFISPMVRECRLGGIASAGSQGKSNRLLLSAYTEEAR